MNDTIRVLVRGAALLALSLVLLIGFGPAAGAQVPPELAPPEEDAPEEEAPEEPAPDDGGGEAFQTPEELDPVVDPLAPVLDPVREQLPGEEAPDDGSEEFDEEGDPIGDTSFTPTAGGPSTLADTGGTAAVGLASVVAAAGLLLRRFLRS